MASTKGQAANNFNVVIIVYPNMMQARAEFGCYQRTIAPAVRYRYLQDVRETFESHGIGWAYWSYNETLTVMTSQRQPFGPASIQTPDRKLLEVLFGSRTRSGSDVK
jgi:hypothetical protein